MKIGYARESTKLESQDQALGYQIERLKRYGCDHVYIDRESGASSKRRGYNEMLALVKAGQVREVVVCAVSRLGRSVIGIQGAIDLFVQRGVKFTTLDGAIDLGTPSGRANMQMQGVWAELERELIRERILNGWEGVRHLKKAVNPPFGYTDIDAKYQLDTRPLPEGGSRAAVAREIVETFLEVRSLQGTVRRIALKHSNLLGVEGKTKGIPKSSAGLKDWLTNPVLQGHTRYKKRGRNVVANRVGECPDPGEAIIYRDTHPDQRLITDEEANQIQEILSFNRFHHGFQTSTPRFPLTGLVCCGVCGKSAQIVGGYGLKDERRYYQCQKYSIGQCSAKTSTRTDRVEQAAIAALIERAEQIADDVSQPDETVEPPELIELRSRLAALERIPGNDPHIESAKEGIRLDIAAFTSLPTVDVNAEMRQKALQALREPEFWEELKQENKADIYRLLIKKIVIRDGAVASVECWL